MDKYKELMVYVGYTFVILPCTNGSPYDDHGCETCIALDFLYVLPGGSLHILHTLFSLLPFVLLKHRCSISDPPLLRCVYIVLYVLLLGQYYYEIGLGVL